MQNSGKIFETDFKNSIPDNVFYYRIPDPPQSFGGGQDNLRFSRKNPCDIFLFSPTSHTLYALELKSVGTNSISFERSKEDKGVIHYHQIKALQEFNTYDGIVAGFVINFRNTEKTYFIEICDFTDMINEIDKKSFNEKDLLKYNPTIIDQHKKRTRYSYDIEKFLRDTALN